MKSFRYEALPVSPQDFEYVNETTGPLAETLFLMNASCFEGGAFEMTRQEIVTRDTSFIEKNGNVFMLIRDPLRETKESDNAAEEFMGFSCVLPLNSVGADVYLTGLIKDRDIRASMLCKEGEPCDAFLVFAIALARNFQKVSGLRAHYYPFLLRCAEHHIRSIAALHPGPSSISVWVQAEHPKLKQHLEERGFRWTEQKKSADGFELYHRSLEIVRSRRTRRKKSVDKDNALV